MATSTQESAVQTLDVTKTVEVAAPIATVWEALLEEIGPHFEVESGSTMPMVLEAWPGGRWYRDLGKQAGHFWGHVQVIKPPALLEISGPLFMSYPAVSHVQYRLTEAGRRTTLTLTHRAIGQIMAAHREGVHKGWQHLNDRIRERAERK
jgi:uncharacterized protein YndB with AHSA1/START domain